MADLTGLISKEKSNDGVWVQAVIYGDKQPFEIMIYGDDSDVVQKFNREKLRKLNIGSGKKLSNDALNDLLNSEDENVLAHIGGLRSLDNEPLVMNGEELTCDRGSYRKLIKEIPDVKEFILEFAKDRTNFLSSGKKN